MLCISYIISDTLLYGHMVCIYVLILMNCFIITKFTFIKNQTFLRKFYTMKIWSHTVYLQSSGLLIRVYKTLHLSSVYILLCAAF